MVRFLDGPALSHTLFLKRAPLFLRVVEDCDGQIDALDSVDDKPTPTETIHIYVLASDANPVHIKGEKLCGWYVTADYKLYHRQPGELVRDTAKWRIFANGQAKLMKDRPTVATAEPNGE